MEHKLCPECGTDLEDITYSVIPPIEEWRCPRCGRRYDKRKTIHMSAAIEKVISERERQMELWGECSDNHPFEWMSILGEEFGELCEAVNETYFKNGAHPEYGGNEKIIKEAVHVAAVAVAIIESAIRAGEG